jgi:poly-D-alanine transfer protein DltD
LQINIKKILNKGNAYIIIHIDGTFKNYTGIKNFIYSLKDYRDKIKIQINSSLASILDLDLTNFNIKLN